MVSPFVEYRSVSGVLRERLVQLEHLARRLHVRVVDVLAFVQHGRGALGLRLLERLDHSVVEDHILRGRREHLVGDRDVRGMDQHHPREAELAVLIGEAARAVRVLEVLPDAHPAENSTARRTHRQHARLRR